MSCSRNAVNEPVNGRTGEYRCRITAKATKLLLRSLFKDIITDDSETAWPPRSPDLTPPDFFVWGYLKDSIFRPPNAPETIDDLRQRITNLCGSITGDMLKSVFRNFEDRLQCCIDLNGGLVGSTKAAGEK